MSDEQVWSEQAADDARELLGIRNPAALFKELRRLRRRIQFLEERVEALETKQSTTAGAMTHEPIVYQPRRDGAKGE